MDRHNSVSLSHAIIDGPAAHLPTSAGVSGAHCALPLRGAGQRGAAGCSAGPPAAAAAEPGARRSKGRPAPAPATPKKQRDSGRDHGKGANKYARCAGRRLFLAAAAPRPGHSLDAAGRP